MVERRRSRRGRRKSDEVAKTLKLPKGGQGWGLGVKSRRIDYGGTRFMGGLQWVIVGECGVFYGVIRLVRYVLLAALSNLLHEFCTSTTTTATAKKKNGDEDTKSGRQKMKAAREDKQRARRGQDSCPGSTDGRPGQLTKGLPACVLL